MFWKRRNIVSNEHYRLISSINSARKDWIAVQEWRISEREILSAHMPKLLAEMRYRYLLKQARERNISNHWYYNDME